MYSNKIVILRARKGVPGVGRKLARAFDANEVTCGFRPKIKVPDGALILNYGRSQWPVWYPEAAARGVVILNTPPSVGTCVNKLSTLQLLSIKGVKCLEFTEDYQEAYSWCINAPHPASIAGVARTTLTGKHGNGIEPFYHATEYSIEGGVFPEAPMYSKFYDKTHEFRAHVVAGKVIDLVQKKRLGSKKREERGIEVDDLVRNHKRGWVFAHNDLICDTGGGRDTIESLAKEACHALGIDFAGVDILAKYDEEGHFVDAVVCEVNSAPGMSSPTTFKAYVKAFSQIAGV